MNIDKGQKLIRYMYKIQNRYKILIPIIFYSYFAIKTYIPFTQKRTNTIEQYKFRQENKYQIPYEYFSVHLCNYHVFDFRCERNQFLELIARCVNIQIRIITNSCNYIMQDIK
ncbi:hypothetical protein pb186bvf_014991 [Paramecium bursaria]